MKILRAQQIKEADQFTIKNEPISSIDLMERAVNQLFLWFQENIEKKSPILVFAGSGNNGGDGLGLARQLHSNGYKVSVYLARFSDHLSEDCQIQFDRLQEAGIQPVEINNIADFPEFDAENCVLVDALFGSGLSRPLEGFSAELVSAVNQTNATVVAIDFPSGLMAEDNSENNKEAIICAHYTLTFEFPKLAFLFADNFKYTGIWKVLPIGLHPDYFNNANTNIYYLSKKMLKPMLIRRQKFDHKGKFGHAFLVAGSYGKMGAAVLCSRACLRSGVGLLTVHVPRLGYEIMQTAIPEAMTSIDKYDKVVSKIPSLDSYAAVGIGPGIGKSRHVVLAQKELMAKIRVPTVFDADALNIMAENRELIDMIPEGSILTPHPKEFERLIGVAENHYRRLQKQIEFARRYKLVIVLKGANTCVVTPNGEAYFNSTGNPGMAKGGCGDILTGIILAFLAQGYSSEHAAVLGVYLHGLAADFAAGFFGYESLLSSDIIQYLGKAFEELKKD